jgi:hypothetical protein
MLGVDNRRLDRYIISMTKQEQMAALGIAVHTRLSHVGARWDFSAPGKGPMDANIFSSPEAAQREAEAHFDRLVALSRRVVTVAGMG